MSRDRLLPPIVAGLVIWTLACVRTGIVAALAGESPVAAVLPSVPPFAFWLAWLPLILRLGAATPLRRGLVGRAVAVHLVAAGAIAALYAELMVRLMTQAWPFPVPASAGPVATWGIRFQFGVMSYGFVLAWGYVHQYFSASRARDLAVARLEAELAQAQLRALKAQLQPHFLFNTLHAVTVLIRRDPEAATRTVMRLSDLLRMTLVDAERQEAPLADELRFVRLYLDIEQTRFRERLQVVWDVPPELGGAAVPTLLLQPLVENALRHGIEPTAAGGRVTIAGERVDGRLVLRVVNDGLGLRPRRTGVGMASVRGRLERLYGEAQRFELAERQGGVVEATVELPYRSFTAERARD
jgi:two-component system, LytTR family, sensor kinase